MPGTPTADQGVIRHALKQGYLQPSDLREAVLLQDELNQAGRATPLLHVLAARYLAPEHLAELRRVHAESQQSQAEPARSPWRGETAEVPDDLLLSSMDRARSAPDQDPERVRSILQELVGEESTSPEGWGAQLFAGAAAALDEGRSERQSLGPYQIRGELARGGMGVVYRAHHPTLGQDVALKVLSAGALASRKQLTRFLIEARAAARLRHPNIVSVHDVGEDQGQHYYVMDLVRGKSLDDRVRYEGRLPPREAVQILATVARALDYAHQEGVIHRDIKPGNVMLSEEGVPLVTDFGLAKELDHDLMLTAAGQTLGSPGFMPPEQVLGEMDRVDARSDVYSLGATLFNCLTGELVVPGKDAFSVMRATVVTRARSLRALAPELDLDLELICAKCLAKDPEERYPSAAALAEDLEAYLADRSIKAREDDVADRARKWIRRNRTLTLGGISLATAALVAISGATLFHLNAVQENLEREAKLRARAEEERSLAKEREVEARASAEAARAAEQRAQRATAQALSAREAERALLGRALAEKARRLLAEGQPHSAAALFARSLQLHEHALARTGVAACLPARWRWRWDSPRPIPSHALAFSPDGDLLAVGTGLSVEVYSLSAKRVVRSLPGHHRRVTALAFDPSGRRLASVSRDGAARIWTLDADSRSRAYQHSGHLLALAWDAEGRRLAVGGADGRVVTLSPGAEVEGELQAHEGAVRGLTYFSDGLLASGGAEGVRLWRAGKGAGALGEGSAVRGLVRVGARLAVLVEGGVQLYRERAPEERHDLPEASALAAWGGTLAVRTPAGVTLLVEGDEPRSIEAPQAAPALALTEGRLALGSVAGFGVWEAASGRRVLRNGGHEHALSAAVVDEARGRVVVGDRGGTIRFWSLKEGAPGGELVGAHPGGVRALALSGSLLFSTGLDRQLRVWNLGDDRPAGTRSLGQSEPGPLCASPEGRVAFALGGTVTVLERQGPGLRRAGQLELGASVTALGWSRGGRWLACAAGAEIELWDPTSGARRTLRGAGPVSDLCFDAQGELLSVGRDGTLRAWTNENKSRVLARQSEPLLCVALSADGRFVATGGAESGAQVWDRAGRSLARFHHPDPVTEVLFAADGALLTCGGDWRVRVWEPGPAGSQSWAGRGSLVALDREAKRACGGGPGVPTWTAASEDLRRVQRLGSSSAVHVARAGAGWATCSAAGLLQLWDLEGKPLRQVQLEGVQRVTQVALDRAGTRALAWGSHVEERPDDPAVRVVIGGKPALRYLRQQIVELFDLEGGRRLARPGLAMPIGAAAFVPESDLALWGADAGALQIQDLVQGSARGRLERHEGKHAQASVIAFSSRGLLATGGSDRSIRLWDLPGRRQLAVFWGHRGLVQALAFSPGGELLASGGDDGTVRLWDIERGEEVVILGGRGAATTSVAFASPTILLSADARGLLTRWDLAALGVLTSPDELVERVWRETGYRCLDMNARRVSNVIWSE